MRWLISFIIINCCLGSAFAQEWPKRRNIEIIVPAAAGSGQDATMRVYTDKLQQNLGQSVIVTNRGGASGTIGASTAARAAPDGYTFVMLSPGQLIVNKYTIKNLNYDPDKDFKPVALLNLAPYFILINPSMPFRDLNQLVAYAKDNHDKVFIAYESATVKAIATHLLNTLGINLTLVPYVNPPQLMQDLLVGNVQMSIQGSALGLAFVKDGRTPALAVTGAKRFPATPNIPTVAESHPAFGSFDTWLMLLAPAGTPDDVVQRMSQEIKKIAALPDTGKLFENLGLSPADDYSPEAAAAFVKQQNEQFATMAKLSDLKPE
jgi:tripartite-type tricarboxylate transporter receptor subunit TctC